MIYGVVATFGSFSILFYVLVTAGGRLVEGRQPTVVMLSMSLLFLKFRRRFRRLFGKRSDSADDLDDDFDDDYACPAFGPSRRRIDQLRTRDEASRKDA